MDDMTSVVSGDTEDTTEIQPDVQTPPTAVTEASDATGRSKRPSDLKTIPCTYPFCGKMFNRQARLEAHVRSHTGERPFKCTWEGCDKAYSDKKYLNGHIHSAHLKTPKFVCQQCDKSFATGQRLERHGLVHLGEDRYRCRDYPPCNETFRKHKTLQRHILKEHLGEKPFKCEADDCNESYNTLNALKAHTQREHGEERFVCGPCSDAVIKDPSLKDKLQVGFTTKVFLEQHIRQKHVNCVFCGDGVPFSGQYELEQHIHIYHLGQTVKDRKTVACEFDGCDKLFVKRSNMKIHYRSAHEGLRYICGKVDTSSFAGAEGWDWKKEGCGHAFTTKVGAQEHALYVHLGFQRPLYESSKQVTRPKKTHSFLDEVSGVTDFERRPVVCTVFGCPARYTRWADLKNHMDAEHPEFTPAARPSQMLQTHDAADFGGQQEQSYEHNWAQEEMDVMQLVDINDAIDPELLQA